jgi:hypothetical protein
MVNFDWLIKTIQSIQVVRVHGLLSKWSKVQYQTHVYEKIQKNINFALKKKYIDIVNKNNIYK